MRTCLILLLVQLAAGSALGAAPDRKGEEQQFYRMELKREPTIAPGSLGAVHGDVDAAGERIVVGDLSVMQPVVVALLASDPLRPLQVDVVKESWDQHVRSVTTDDQGVARMEFRTQESFGLLVHSATDERASYELLVWAGDEPSVQPRSVFAAAQTEPRESMDGSRGSSHLMLAAGLFVVFGLAACWFWFAAHRKPRGG